MAIAATSARAAAAASATNTSTTVSSEDQGPPPGSGSAVICPATVGITKPRRGITVGPVAGSPRVAASSVSCAPAGAAERVGSNGTQPMPLK